MAIIQRAMNPRILIAALVLPLITAELTGFNNAERRVLGMHVTNVPPEIDRSPMTIYFVDIRFKSPLGVTAPHKWTTFNRMLMPYKLVIDNDTISIEVDNDEQACFNAGYYMLVSGHFRSYKPGPFINHIKSYAPKCIDLEGFYMYNGLYRSNNYANLVKDLLPMLMYGEEPAISLIESEMMRCFFHSVSAYDAKPPIDVLTDDDLYTEMAFSQERCLRYKELYTSYETDNHINVTIFGVTSHSCPMGFMIPKPDYTIGLPVVFHNRPTDPGKFDDIIDVPDGFRKVKPIKFGASYDSQYQTYTFMVSHFRGKSLHFQHHEDIWAPSFRIYPTWFECDTYQLTLSFFDDNKCNVKIKSTNSAVEVWFGTHYAKQEKPDFLLHSPYVEMFVEEGELRVYIENAPTFYIGRFCPDYAHFVNEKTWLRIKMKRLRPTCDNGLALRVGRHVRWIEEIPIPGVVSLYNRTEDEYYDTDYDGNPVDSSTASFQPWYIAAGIAVLLVLLFGVTAFIGKRYIDRIPTQ